MRPNRVVFIVLIVILPWLLMALAGASETGDGHWTVEKVADGVWAALQPHEGRFDDANVVFIEREHDLVVVDSPANADSLRELIAEIGRLSPKPVRFVINTHWHEDHTRGNALYREAWGKGVSFLGHETLAEDVPGRDAPDLTYSKSMTLRGSPRIELLHFRAHTRGDTVVYLPGRKVLITGDLLDDLPYVGHGHPREWLETLETLAELRFDRIVPGHGPVFEGRNQMEAITGFIRALVDGAAAAVTAGKTLEAAQTEIDLSIWRERLGRDDAGKRFFDQTAAEAIERAYNEAKE